MNSPLLTLPGAVSGDGPDAPVAAHYGSFNGEQRALEKGDGFVDLSHRDVLRITGPDRYALLHALTTQHEDVIQSGEPTAFLVLSPQGHVEHAAYAQAGDDQVTAHLEPGAGAALRDFLTKMRFMMQVEIDDVTADTAITWRAAKATEQPFSGYDFVPRAKLAEYAAAAGPAAGTWAFEALRIARGEARFGLDTDHRTIPNEVGWINTAVHLDKGCYRGQETVARVHTLGRPPRRLTLLHLDGSENRLPKQGNEITTQDGKVVGFVGTSSRHHELGPIALAMLKRNVAVDAPLTVDNMPAAQEVIVDPEVGLHVRPNLRG